MHTLRKYDVFISYRRDGGDDCAMWLKTRLERDGFHPYLDVDAHAPGFFTEQIAKAIEESDSVILLLTRNCLDRCMDNPLDTVRGEIAAALKRPQQVVGIMKRGFSFPETLPEDIDSVRRVNALPLENYYREDFYQHLLKALREIQQRVSSAPVETARSLSLPVKYAGAQHAGHIFAHLSDDYRLIGLPDPASGYLQITEVDTARAIARLAPVKHPFSEYALSFDASSRYLYLVRQNNVLIFDISRNAYVTKKEIALPFAANHQWDTVHPMPEQSLLFLCCHEGRAVSAVHLLPDGTTYLFDLKKQAFGFGIASAVINGLPCVITAREDGKLCALYARDKKLHVIENDELIAACLQSGKRFGAAFSPENLYWQLSSGNGVTRYTDIFRTQDGAHLHRIFHGSNRIFFTPDHTAVWYDAQRGQVIETEFLDQRDKVIIDSHFFSAQECFWQHRPFEALYLEKMDLFAFLCVSADDRKLFRLVLTDRAGRVLAASKETAYPDDAVSCQLSVSDRRLALAFICQHKKAQRTALFLSHIQENM